MKILFFLLSFLLASNLYAQHSHAPGEEHDEPQSKPVASPKVEGHDDSDGHHDKPVTQTQNNQNTKVEVLPRTTTTSSRSPSTLSTGEKCDNCDEPCVGCNDKTKCKNTKAFDSSRESKEIKQTTPVTHDHETSATPQ